MKASVADSRLARFVAAKEWPDVQRQKKYADGAYWFSCAGHGGTVVLLDRFNAAAQKALRACGLVEFVVAAKTTRGAKLYYSREYDAAKLLAWAREHDCTVVEVAVGEEDCGWACLFLADDRLRDGYNAAFREALVPTRHVVVDDVKNWSPDFYTALTGKAVTADESYVMGKRKFADDNADNYVTRAAWGEWHDEVPVGFVGVVAARKSDGDERYFLVPTDEYQARDGSYVVRDTSAVWATAMDKRTKEVVCA